MDRGRRWPYGADLVWLVGLLGLSFAAAALGATSTARTVDTWYRTLRKPTWTPPDRVFGPVWTVLYTLIGVSAWLVQRQARTRPERAAAGWRALVAWLAQLALNAAWSAVFFGRRQLAGGLAVSAALWATIGVYLALAARVSRWAAVVLVPYWAWVAFATALNARIWQLSRVR
jgi:tryptophan-rich sensory protein